MCAATTVAVHDLYCCLPLLQGQGGCIYAGEVASLNVVDCTLTDNGLLPGSSEAATGNGGAIATDGTRTSNVYPVNLIVRRSKFVGNTAAVGGAIFAAQFASGKGRVEVHECMFTNNTVSCAGA
jgi:hypothetical protein